MRRIISHLGRALSQSFPIWDWLVRHFNMHQLPFNETTFRGHLLGILFHSGGVVVNGNLWSGTGHGAMLVGAKHVTIKKLVAIGLVEKAIETLVVTRNARHDCR